MAFDYFEGPMCESMLLDSIGSADKESLFDKYWVSRRLAETYKDRLNWSLLSDTQAYSWSDDFYREFQDYIDWSVVSSRSWFSKDIALEFYSRIDWYAALKDDHVSDATLVAVCDAHPEFIKQWHSELPYDLTKYPRFMAKYSDQIDFKDRFFRIPEDYLESHWDELKSSKWLRDYLSPEFIQKHYKDVPPESLLKYQYLTEDFIQDHLDYFSQHMDIVGACVVLSSEFIRKNADILDFNVLATYQTLSEDIILEFRHKIQNDILCKHQRIPDSIISEYPEKKDPWLYYTTDRKKEIILPYTRNHYDDFFIAWFPCDNDGVLDILPRRKAVVGDVVEVTVCDFYKVNTDYSFYGIPVMFNRFDNPFSECTMRVKVYYKDLCGVASQYGAVWGVCRKFTILKVGTLS